MGSPLVQIQNATRSPSSLARMIVPAMPQLGVVGMGRHDQDIEHGFASTRLVGCGRNIRAAGPIFTSFRP